MDDKQFNIVFNFTFYVACFSTTYALWFYHRQLPLPYGPGAEPLIGIFAIPCAFLAYFVESLFTTPKKWWFKKILGFLGSLAILLALPIDLMISSFDLWFAGIGILVSFYIGSLYEKDKTK